MEVVLFFFFKQKTAYEIKECDWSSDVCSSDLTYVIPLPDGARYLGFLFARADTPLEVETSLAAARNELEIVIIAD